MSYNIYYRFQVKYLVLPLLKRFTAKHNATLLRRNEQIFIKIYNRCCMLLFLYIE